MRAELILMGKRIDMAPQRHRRTLVLLIYASMASIMTGLWFLDHWRTTGAYMIFVTIAVNRLLLGGYNFGGLVKPFNDKAHPAPEQPSPFLLLGLRVYRPQPGDSEYRNDERELQQRDHAHYVAYSALVAGLVLIWFAAAFTRVAPKVLAATALLSLAPNLGVDLVYGITLATIVISVTLPQSILLWTEPDMPELDEFES
jgi:hypothetical protein